MKFHDASESAIKLKRILTFLSMKMALDGKSGVPRRRKQEKILVFDLQLNATLYF